MRQTCGWTPQKMLASFKTPDLLPVDITRVMTVGSYGTIAILCDHFHPKITGATDFSKITSYLMERGN